MSDPSREALLRGASLFDQRAFFEAHEAWEERWLVEVDPARRRVLQGLIQIAAGFHKHLAMGDSVSASRLLGKGLAKLDGRAELTGFREAVRACAGALAAGHLDASAIPALGSWVGLLPMQRAK